MTNQEIITKSIYCCECKLKVDARLTNGEEVYPIRYKRMDYHSFPYWICDTCKNYVGCHHKTSNPTNPLGCIPNDEIKKARRHLHALIDPIWQNKLISRTKLYNLIATQQGRKNYHTAQIRTIEEARSVYKIVLEIKKKFRG